MVTQDRQYFPSRGGSSGYRWNRLRHGGIAPTLYALDLADGEEHWTLRFADESVGAAPDVTYHAPTIYDGTVYVGTETGGVYAVSASGEQRWAVSPVGHVTGSLAVDASGIYVPGEETFAKVTVDTPEATDWTAAMTGGTRSPTLADNYIVGADEDTVWARTKEDGEFVWSRDPEFRSRDDVRYTGKPKAPILNGGVVYATSNAGRISALGPG